MNRDSELRVGYTQYNYNAARNCYAPVPGVRHQRVGRVPVDRLVGQGTAISLRQGIYVPFGRPRVDVVHLWNQISAGRAPWGVSFESGLPRVPEGRGHRFLQHRLTSTACRFVVGISSFAQDSFLHGLPLDLRQEIEPKTTVVYPYQRANASTAIVPPAENEPLNVIFVGGDFFRKGGEAVLRFVERYGSHYNVQALVVSDVGSRDWASPWSYDASYVSSIRTRLEREARVSWISSMSNGEVLEAMRRSHVLLFPTLSDTFGYVSLEAMSCGLPVVATTVQALPEVVDTSVGWTIQLPVGQDLYWDGFIDEAWASDQNAYEEAMDRIVHGLIEAAEDVRADPETLRERSARCIARIGDRFGSERTAHLKAVYSTVAS
jgi:glycosyltransferase involved in cell wall biosynthesis